jgi:periplasmic protein TonB
VNAVSVALPIGSPFGNARGRRAPVPAKPPLPAAAILVSLAAHAVIVALLLAISFWGPSWPRAQVQVVNLVPAIAAVGDPAGRVAAQLPTRTLKPPTAVPPRPEPEPEPRAREAPRAVEPALPPRAVLRTGEKELPQAPTDRRARTVGESASRPQQATALGQATGSAAGAGSLTLDVTDFPHAWYLRQVLAKVQERWQSQNRASEPDQKPLIWVEINRDGSIATPRIERSSGNTFYDQAALRAIVEASPFPQLPADWTKSSLRVLFNFELRRG